MRIFTCLKCSTPIKLNVIRGYVHLTCPHCGAKYQLTQTSIKRYMAIPLASVAIAVYSSLTFLQGRTIDVKFIFILATAFLLAAFFGYILIHIGWLKYEEKEEE